MDKISHWRSALAALFTLALLAAPSAAQRATNDMTGDEVLVQLDFDDVELAAVIETIAQLTNKNFIYDDRVRGRVTIVSPSQVTVEQAYAVFESVLQVKGFTTVTGPGGAIKVIPVREAKESSIETVSDGAPSPNRDHFVTRLIPVRFINAGDITNILKPLVSKDAAMVAYPQTNTIILTDTASNIRRLLEILDAIDVASHREELAVIKVEHADAGVLGEQISEIYGAEVSTTGASAAPRARRARRARGAGEQAVINPQLGPGVRVRIITDTRTNSLLVLAPSAQIADVRKLIVQLDVPVEGSGRIHVHYLKHADAEELAQTLNSLLSGQQGAPSAGATRGAGQPGAGAQLRSAVTELAEGITLTADPGTNSLVIQASKEAYETLSRVIEKLDIQRPQVLVEALIMEVDVTDSMQLGFNALVEFMGDWDISIQSVTDAAAASALGQIGLVGTSPFAVNAAGQAGDTTIQTLLRAAASDNTVDVISAPHILTSDNEEAEIRIGNNIPIITSRLDGAVGNTDGGLSTSVNVERQDIGVTLRVTPQISEGNTLRLKIFQELSDVNEGLTMSDFSGSDTGVALTNTQIENTVVVSDGETVVIGGLISDNVQDTETKVPFLGDIPGLGWAFKTVETSTTKQNLLLFLTPHIIRSKADLERATIDRREQFSQAAGDNLALDGDERDAAEAEGISLAKLRGHDPVRGAVLDHRERYPVDRMSELAADPISRVDLAPDPEPRYGLQAAVFASEQDATETLTKILEGGHDGALVTTQVNGSLIYEIHVGPFESLGDARTARAMLRGSLGLDPSVMVLATEEE
ncbi:MAG: type II secretion system secretin GspD [Myxococcota bacterium]|nr:type II secretion system secretin GspD [Myxococcota bacterium]